MNATFPFLAVVHEWHQPGGFNPAGKSTKNGIGGDDRGYRSSSIVERGLFKLN